MRTSTRYHYNTGVIVMRAASFRLVRPLFAVMLLASVFYRCDSIKPTVSVMPCFEASNGRQSNRSITDTVWNTVRVGVAVYSQREIDSIGMRITADGEVLFDTMFTAIEYNDYDTVWKDIHFTSPGEKVVTITPYTQLNIANLTATIKIVPGSGPPNTAPTISVKDTEDTLHFWTATSYTLEVSVSDADTDQVLDVTVDCGIEFGTLVNDSTFYCGAIETDTGYNTIIFIVKDNGKPPLSDTDTVVVFVTPIPNAPTVDVPDSITMYTLETCRYPVIIKMDPGWGLAIRLIGAPDGAMVVNDTFVWTAPRGSAGVYNVEFFVRVYGVSPVLSGGGTTVITVIEGSENNAPTWNVDTLSVSIPDTASYILDLDTLCNDIDGDKLTYTLADGTPQGDTVIGNAYSFIATFETVGGYLIAFIASDAYGGEDTMYLSLSVDSTESEN